MVPKRPFRVTVHRASPERKAATISKKLMKWVSPRLPDELDLPTQANGHLVRFDRFGNGAGQRISQVLAERPVLRKTRANRLCIVRIPKGQVYHRVPAAQRENPRASLRLVAL